VGMLGAEAPATSLPKGAFFNPMTGFVLIASKAIWELDFVSPSSLAEYCVAFPTVFSFFDIRWALGSEDMWNPIITGGNKESGGGRGMYGKEMLLKVGYKLHLRLDVVLPQVNLLQLKFPSSLLLGVVAWH